MSDGFSLLLVLSIVYLSDCIIFLHRHSVALVRPWRRWFPRLPGNRFGNARGALLGLQPFPPLGAVHELAVWPVSISEDGVCAFAGYSFSGSERPPQPATVMRHADISSVTARGHTISVNGKEFVTAHTEAAASELAALISRVAAAPREKKAQIVSDAIDASLDVKAAADAAAVAASGTVGLRIACIVFWCYIYLLCPALTFAFGLGWLLLPLAAAGLAIHIPIVVWFTRSHRRMFPAERGARLEQVFRMSLCPPMAIRAVDALTRHALWRCHPGAGMLALCDRPEAAAIGSLMLRDLRYPAQMPLEGEAARIEASFRTILSQRFEAMLRGNGIEPRVLPEESHVSSGSRTFCPRCLNVFSLEIGSCQDCINVNLVPLPGARTQRKAER